MDNLLAKCINFALQVSNEGVIISDSEGRILYLTEKAKEMLGVNVKPDGALNGKCLNDVFPDAILFKKMHEPVNSNLEEVLPIFTGDRNLFCLCRLEQLIESNEKVIANILFLKLRKRQEINKDEHSNNLWYSFDDIIGVSKQMEELRSKGRAFALSDSTVLILGETGTGKELLAQALHSASQKKDKPFIPVNCAAIPNDLLESELFGYEEGSFTGAKKGGKPGRFEIASGGTIFLDEIGDMPLFLQAKLLRVLQERKLERVGGIKQIPIDIRVIAATHKDLEELVKEDKFRSDLYYRLNVLPLQLPPLRERKDDIYILLEHLLKKHTVLAGKTSKRFSAKVLNFFFNYSWPGNIRELENVVEYVVSIPCKNNLLDLHHLPPYLAEQQQQASKQSSTHKLHSVVKVKDMELQQIAAALKRYGNTTQGKKNAAKALGISLATLYRKLKEPKS